MEQSIARRCNIVVALKLRDLGFDEICDRYYSSDVSKEVNVKCRNSVIKPHQVTLPTFDAAIDWIGLRFKIKIKIDFIKPSTYNFVLIDTIKSIIINYNSETDSIDDYISSDGAKQAGLLYCVNNIDTLRPNKELALDGLPDSMSNMSINGSKLLVSSYKSASHNDYVTDGKIIFKLDASKHSYGKFRKVIAAEAKLITEFGEKKSCIRCKFSSFRTINHPCKKECSDPIANMEGVKTLFIDRSDMDAIELASEHGYDWYNLECSARNVFRKWAESLKKVISIDPLLRQNDLSDRTIEFMKHQKSIIIDEDAFTIRIKP